MSMIICLFRELFDYIQKPQFAAIKSFSQYI